MTRVILYFLVFFQIGCQSKFSGISVNEKLKDKNSNDFSFAIIADLNGGEREGIFENAVSKINRMHPVFTLSVGDLIDGGIKDSQEIELQWEIFDQRLKKLNSPFYYVGGNHDLSNVEMVKSWEKRYGPTYYHFKYKNVLFLILNSEDYSNQRFNEIFEARDLALKVLSGEVEGEYEETEYFKMTERSFGDMSDEQLNYFENVIKQNEDVRWTFLFMHKPLWKNKNNRKFQSLLEKLKTREYSVFSGHEHSFSQELINGKSFTILATTGGSQNPNNPNAFDHFTWISMKEKPSVSHFLLDGVLNERGLNN